MKQLCLSVQVDTFAWFYTMIFRTLIFSHNCDKRVLTKCLLKILQRTIHSFFYIYIYRDILYNFDPSILWLYIHFTKIIYKDLFWLIILKIIIKLLFEYVSLEYINFVHFHIQFSNFLLFFSSSIQVNRFSQVWNPFPENSVRPRITSTILCIGGITCIIYVAQSTQKINLTTSSTSSTQQTFQNSFDSSPLACDHPSGPAVILDSRRSASKMNENYQKKKKEKNSCTSMERSLSSN